MRMADEMPRVNQVCLFFVGNSASDPQRDYN
jgi:hypothetical protein